MFKWTAGSQSTLLKEIKCTTTCIDFQPICSGKSAPVQCDNVVWPEQFEFDERGTCRAVSHFEYSIGRWYYSYCWMAKWSRCWWHCAAISGKNYCIQDVRRRAYSAGARPAFFIIFFFSKWLFIPRPIGESRKIEICNRKCKKQNLRQGPVLTTQLI